MRKWLFALLLVSTPAFGQFKDIERQEFRDLNLVENPGCENGVSRWTNSGGGSFAATSTTADVGFGTRSCEWDASAASDALTGNQITIPPGLYGKLCYLRALQKGGDSNISFQAYDGSSVIGTQTLSAQTTFKEIGFAFTCPSSGTIAPRLLASGDAAVVQIDQVFLGFSPDQGLNTSPVVQTFENVVGSVGSSGQVAAGHLYGESSFDFTFADDIAFWYLQDADDDSGATSCNAGADPCTLTNNGSIGFTATDIFGNASSAASLNGSTQHFSTTDVFFDPGDSDFTALGWFAATDWTPSGTENLFGQGSSGTDRGWRLTLLDTGEIRLNISNTAGSASVNVLSVPNPGFVDGTYHQLGFSFRSSDDLATIYIDGVTAASKVVSEVPRDVTSPAFSIGSFANGTSQFFSGSVGPFVYATRLLSPEDVRKLHSYKQPLGISVPPESQEWLGLWKRADGSVQNQLENGWLIDKRNTEVFWDLSDLGASDTATLILKQLGDGPVTVASQSFSTGALTAAPSFPLAHGLPGTPKSVWVVTQGQGTAAKYQIRTDLCEWDSTNIHDCDLSVLSIGAGQTVEIKASMYDLATAADCANGATSGLLCGAEQSVDGNKTFTGVVTVGDDLVIEDQILFEQPLDTFGNQYLRLEIDSASHVIVEQTGNISDLDTSPDNIANISNTALVFVSCRDKTDTTEKFGDLVLAIAFGSASVVGSVGRDSPQSRTYTVSGGQLQIALDATDDYVCISKTLRSSL